MKKKFLAIRAFASIALVVGLTACGGGSSVTNVNLGGAVTGLTADKVGNLVLTNTGTTSTMTVSLPPGTSSFSFPTRISVNASFDVAVTGEPQHTLCNVTDGTGVAGTSDISVQVACVPTHRLGVTVNGPIPAGLTLVNGSYDSLTLSADSSNVRTLFFFQKEVGENVPFAVHVQPGVNCAVDNNSGIGTMGTADNTDVTVTCT